ncbi:FAD-dependent oxidoreductase, partial [Acidiphilium sp.]|uniref:FAD-dependent oxidoreductase n=1 Tax=Acidiphilium sp. TaxID=527 RepID=UPI002585466A
PLRHTGKKVAVVGTGPAGLACAQQLARTGHRVICYEKNVRVGGLLRYGIPDFKMEKSHIDRRVAQMQAEGVEFRVDAKVGAEGEFAADRILAAYDAVVLAGGAEQPRDLPIPGRELGGIHFAMDFLRPQNQRNAGEPAVDAINVAGQRVVVIGGGDTGSDCVGTCNRQGARSVTQFELL